MGDLGPPIPSRGGAMHCGISRSGVYIYILATTICRPTNFLSGYFGFSNLPTNFPSAFVRPVLDASHLVSCHRNCRRWILTLRSNFFQVRLPQWGSFRPGCFGIDLTVAVVRSAGISWVRPPGSSLCMRAAMGLMWENIQEHPIHITGGWQPLIEDEM